MRLESKTKIAILEVGLFFFSFLEHKVGLIFHPDGTTGFIGVSYVTSPSINNKDIGE